MKQEDAPFDEEPGPIPRDRERVIGGVTYLAAETRRMLLEIDAARELSYSDANGVTVFTLRDLIELDSLVNAGIGVASIENAGKEALKRLPFSAEDRRSMAERIDGTEADEWYETASDNDILMIDRWRRCLDEWFSDVNLEDPDNPGKQLIRSLEALEETCGTTREV